MFFFKSQNVMANRYYGIETLIPRPLQAILTWSGWEVGVVQITIIAKSLFVVIVSKSKSY